MADKAPSIADKIQGMQQNVAATATTPGAPNLSTMLGNLDLSNVSDGFKIIPDGTDCHFEVVESVPATSKDNNNPMINITLSCVFPAEYVGTKVWDHLVLIPASLWKFKSMAGACDLLAEDRSTFVGRSEKDFVGCIVGAQVEVTTYNGRDRNKIKGGYSEVNAEYKPGNVATGSNLPKFG